MQLLLDNVEWKSNSLSRLPNALWICKYIQNTSGRANRKQPQWLHLRKRMKREHGNGKTYNVYFCSMLSPQVIQSPEHALGVRILGLSDFPCLCMGGTSYLTECEVQVCQYPRVCAEHKVMTLCNWHHYCCGYPVTKKIESWQRLNSAMAFFS